MNFIIINGQGREGARKYEKKLKFSHVFHFEGVKGKYPDFFLNFLVIWVCAELPALVDWKKIHTINSYSLPKSRSQIPGGLTKWGHSSFPWTFWLLVNKTIFVEDEERIILSTETLLLSKADRSYGHSKRDDQISSFSRRQMEQILKWAENGNFFSI